MDQQNLIVMDLTYLKYILKINNAFGINLSVSQLKIIDYYL